MIRQTDDEILWKAFKSGDDDAFATIYDKYFEDLYNYSTKFINDKSIVKDCIHSLFLKLWENRQNLNDTDSIKYYLFKAMRNNILDTLSFQKKFVGESKTIETHFFEFTLPRESEIINEQLTGEQKQKILIAINLLTLRQKEAVFLRFYQNLSYEQIASIMELHVDSTYNLIYRAIAVLKQYLRPLLILLVIFPNY